MPTSQNLPGMPGCSRGLVEDELAPGRAPSPPIRTRRHAWILNHYAVEPGQAGGTRHFSLAKHLVEFGWDATIFAASVVLNTGQQRLSPGETIRSETHEGVSFRWIRTPTYSGNGPARFANMLAFSLRMLDPRSLRKLPKPDLIIGSSVHPLASASGSILAFIFRIPFVFEIRDLWPQTLIDMGAISARGVPARLLRMLERFLCARAALIVVLLPDADRYLVAHGVDPSKILWLPNGVDLASHPEPTPPEERETFTLMYFGAHGQANGLDKVLHCMTLIERMNFHGKSIRLRLIGDGPQKPALIELARNLGLISVTFEAPVPKASIPRLASEADAFVFSLRDIDVLRYGVSANKLFDYLAAGRPIIYFCGAGGEVIESSGAGIAVEAENVEGLAQAIQRLAQLPAESRREMGIAGRKMVVEGYGFRKLAKRLAARLDLVLDQVEV